MSSEVSEQVNVRLTGEYLEKFNRIMNNLGIDKKATVIKHIIAKYPED